MKLNVILTGLSSELLKGNHIEFRDIASVGDLKKELLKKIPALSRYSFQISVNGLLADDSLVLADSDEIVVFNPFAGG
jgi:molybdopterin converting factor small subunit